MDDSRGSVAPVNQPVGLVAQRWREVPGAELFVADVVDAGTDRLCQEVWMDLRSWLGGEKRQFSI